jgi:transcriptional regulator with XRE-family HTH domain
VAIQRPSDNDSFADWLMYFMEQRGIKNTEVAEIMGVNPATVSKWTNGHTIPDVPRLEHLARILGLRGQDRIVFLQVAGKHSFVSLNETNPQVAPVPAPYTPLTLDPHQYIVGRDPEIEQFDQFLATSTLQVLNIYGPGGIGKTVLSKLLNRHATLQGVTSASVDGTRPGLTPIGVIETFYAALGQNVKATAFLSGIGQELRDYDFVQGLISRGAGIESLYDTLGSPRDRHGFESLLATSGSMTEKLRQTVSNRFALERYLRHIEQSLTKTFAHALEALVAKHPDTRLLFVVDTYETLEDNLDDWVCQDLMSVLPSAARLAILGRNTLTRVNVDWSDWHHRLLSKPLDELPETQAKAFLRHHGLTDATQLQQVYQYVRGYPILLVLASQLARELGGWEKIGALSQGGDREIIAQHLLERIMREERVQPMREFLEKGVVAPWFNAEVVSVILQVSTQEGLAIYNQVQRHSFIEPHPYGKKFHDKIREVLLERLKIVSPFEHIAIATRLRDYFEQKAEAERDVSLPRTDKPPTQE